MNKVYRLVWNALLGTWVCAAETARARGKGGRGLVNLRRGLVSACTQACGGAAAFRLALLPLALMNLEGLAHAAQPPPAATALPVGGQVVAGQALVRQTGSVALTIEQNSARAAIDWQSFNIGAAAAVNFVQPSSQAVALNRVVGADPSQILGKLTANGQVFLSNPNGVIFGRSASVDVGALVATTHSINNADFMAGGSTFTRDGATGSVHNRGRLSAANGGYIALLAPEVRNSGVIVAQAGTVAMAGGESITLNFAPDSGLAGIVVTPAQIRTLVQNRRAVLADDGQIILAARSVDELQSSVVNSGTLSATSLVDKGGRVMLDGDDITLTATSSIEAQGATGGGTVMVGNDPTAPATSVTMAAGATIDASATAQGDGGTVVLWSDLHDNAANTQVHGTILARGGAQGGNGGQVETSGAHLQFDGARIDTSAAPGTQGSTGHWLLDPYDLSVDATNAATISSNLASSNITLQTTASGTSGPGIANASGNGDITIASAINWSSANTLTLDAYRSIAINASVAAGNTGKVVLKTNDGGSGGDYSFGLGAGGFSGRLSFGTTPSSAALTINGSAYTLIYDLTAGANGLKSLNGASSGNYALANTLSATALGTVTAAVVGTFGNAFVHTPNFTGLGNSITGLTMNVSGSKNGLFGENFAVIRDIGVTSASIADVGAASSGNGVSNVGLLAGNNTGGAIKNAYSTGSVVLTSSLAANNQVGGLVGLSNGATIDGSFSNASVNSQGTNIGGLVGQLTGGGAITNSYATGTVTSSGANVGGLVGSMDSSGNLLLGNAVLNSYATGNVTAATGGNVGGLIGNANGGILANQNIVTNTYATGTIAAGGVGAGGLIGGSGGYLNLSASRATGSVTNNNSGTGGLVGAAVGATIATSYATGNVTSTTSNGINIGGLVGDLTGTISASYASGAVNGYGFAGGLAGSTRLGSVISDAYATGSVGVSSGFYAGGLVGYVGAATTITNVYASGAIPTASAANHVGALIGESLLATLTNGYWNSTVAGLTGFGTVPSVLTGGGAMTTSQLNSGLYPNGYSPSTWGVLSGISPYLLGVGQPAITASYQLINGTATTTGGAVAAAGGTINLYGAGSLLATTSSNASGVYGFNVPVGTLTGSTPLAETLGLSGAPGTVVGAVYSDTRTLSSGNLLGANVTQGVYAQTTASASDSALQTLISGAYGASTYASVNTALASANKQLKASGAFTIDDALTGGGGLSVQAAGNLTLGTGGSAVSSGGNVSLSSTGGSLAINAASTFATANTLTYDAFANVTINAPVTVSGAGKVVIVSGDTALNGSGTAAGDYGFGLTANGFSGALNFTNAAGGGQTLTLNNAAYTLLYTQANLAAIGTGFGKYALANSLDLSAAGTLSASLVTGFATGAIFTGLGHTINGMTVSTSGQFVGLVGTNSGVIRDVGVTNGAVTTTSAFARASLIAGQNSKTLQNVYATGTVTALGQTSGQLGLLSAQNNVGTISNAWGTGTVTTSGTTVQAGGLVGSNSGGTLSNTLASVTIKSTATAGSLGGLVGDSSSGSASITNSYAMGAVNGAGTSDKIGGLVGNVGSGTTVSSSYATGYVNETGTGSTSGGAIGANAGTIANVYYDASTTGKADSGKGASQTTAQLQAGSLPTGLAATGWSAASGQYPYLAQFFPNGMQTVSGTGYQANGSVAAAAAVSLYAGGSAVSTFGALQTGANGYYYALMPTGLLPAGASSAIGGTMTLSGAGSISAASYAAPPTLAAGSVTGFNFRTGVFTVGTNATTSSTFTPNYAATFGSGVYANVTTLASAGTTQINTSGAFTIDSALALTGGLTVQAAGTLTLAAGGSATSANGNVALTTTVGDVVVNTAVNYAGSNTLTYDAAANVTFNAPVTVSGAGKVVIVSGDTGNNGVGTAVGDYGFGLTANGFSGALNFTNTPGGGQTLTINNAAYTLLYSQANLAGISAGTGKYALAGNLDLSAAGTLTAAVTASLGTGAVFSGLGHTVNGLTIADSINAAVGLFGTSSGMVRDVGVTGGSVTGSASGTSVGDVIGSLGGTGGARNLYAAGAVNLNGTGGQAGGLIGRINSAVALTNGFATGAVTSASTASGNSVGGLVGAVSGGGTLSNVFATGAVIATAASGANLRLGGLVGNASSFTLSNAFASGAVSDNSNGASANLGGLIGSASSGTLSSALALGAISGSTSASGGLIGASTTLTLSNGYYDAGTTGQSDSGKGISQTTAQLQSGSLPSGFASSAWSAGSGLYPYLTPYFPNSVQAITGTAYQSNGTAAKNAGITLYAGGSAITTLGAVASGVNGYYYALTPTGLLPASATTRIGGTLALNGGSLSGASYSDAPIASAVGITLLDLKSGLFNIGTTRTTASALNADLAATLGAGNTTSISAATNSGQRQISSSGAFTLDVALSQGGSVGINAAGDLAINATLTTGTAVLQSSGNVSDGMGGSISATNLALLGGNVVLDNDANAVTTLAATGVSALTFAQINALTLGSVGPVRIGIGAANINGTSTLTPAGVSATGAVNIASLGDNLTVAQNVATTSSGASAIILNAGQNAAAGTATGGNLILSGGATISTGLGGRATLYSGSATADTSLAALIGLGTGRFRYDSDESTQNYTSALGTGLYGIYRQGVNTGLVTNGQSVVYSSAPTAFTGTSGLVNGDTATFAASGLVSSSSGNTAVGNYAIGASNLSALLALGYTSAGNTLGTYAVTPKTLGLSGLTAFDKIYDGTTTASVNTAGAAYTGLITGDLVSLSASGNFNNKNVGTGKAVALSEILGGTDAGNYSLTQQTAITANITPKFVTVSGVTGVNKVYDGGLAAAGNVSGASISGLIGGDVVSVASASGSFADKNVGSGKLVTLIDVLGGTDAGNYSVSSASLGIASITPKALTLSGVSAADKVYDGTTLATINTAGAVLGGLVGGDNVTIAATGTFSDKNVGTGKTVSLTDLFGGVDLGNYSISGQASTTANITPRSLVVSGIGASNKVYDGTTNANLVTTGLVLSGLVIGDTVNLASITGAYADKNVGVNKTVSLLSGYSGTDAGNYAITSQAGTTADISAAPLSLSTANLSKVYDGTTGASGAALVVGGTLFSGDSLSGGTFTFNNKNVGLGNKVVTVSGVNVNDGNGGANYALSYVSNTASSITPKGLSVSGITAADKVYDGSTSAAVNTAGAVLSGLVGGDNVSLSATGLFGDKNAGAGKTVALTDVFSGSDAGNYTITGQASTTASITTKTLTVSQLAVADRTYDGTAVATVLTGGAQYAGLIVGDSFSIASATGSFADKNVGVGKAVSIASIYTGADVGNYTVIDQASTTATITAAPLTVSTVDVSKVYDGTTTVFGGQAVATAGTLFGGDTLTSGSFAYASKNVGIGNKVVVDVISATVNDGNGGNNYHLTYLDNTNSTITPKALNVSGITAADKVYDGTNQASISTAGAVYSGLVGGDDVTLAVSGAFADKNVGASKTIALTDLFGGADAGNYTITGQAGTAASITPKTLTVSQLVVADRTYDGTATATVLTGGAQYAGLVVGDSVSIASATGTFANKNVGVGKTVSITSSYSGADVGNYNMVDQASTTATISAAPLTVSTVDVSKVYDGTTTVIGGQAIILAGSLFGSDSLAGGNFAYASKNVGAGNKVVVDVLGATINDGNGGGNYALSYVNNTNSSITPKALNVSGITVADKVYDGTAAAAINTTGAVYAGLISGDNVTLAVSGAFADKNVGANKAIALTDLFGGSDAGNYTITGQAGTAASITPKTLTVSQLAVADRTYDGTATATVLTGGAQYAGLVVGDSVSIASATGTFANKNVGVGKSVSIASSYSGSDVPNYAIVDQAATTATITAAPLTVSTVDVSKVYDGTTTVFGGQAVAAAGTLFGGDTLTGGTFAYTSKNVGAGNKVVVDVLGATLSDGNGGNNYALSYVNNTTSSITPKALNVSGISVSDKVYDGTTHAAIDTAGAVYSGLVSGDDITLAVSGAFGDKNVGASKPIVLTDLFGGADAGNYTITSQSGTTASITPKTLTISQLSVADRSYNGSAVATVLTGGAQYAGLVVGDNVTVSATGAFADRNVGVGKAVNIASSYGGSDVTNYAIVDQAATSATITAAPLTVSTVDVSKVYDGTTTVIGGQAVVLAGTLFGGDSLGGGTFAYTSKNVGVGNKVVVDVIGATINDGNSGGNYSVIYLDNTNSTITPKALSISGITAANKIYDGTASVTLSTSGLNLGGLVSGDDVTVSASGAFGDKNVGAGKAVTLSDVFGGGDAGNYTITGQASTTASITPKTLTVSQLSVADRTYDGTAVASVVTGGAQFSGLVTGDSFSIASATGSFADKNVGTAKAVSIATAYSGADVNNYAVVDQTATSTSITAAPLVVSVGNVSKVYDGTTAVVGGTAVAVGGTLFGGDTLSAGNFAYASKNVGAGDKVVDVLGATVNDGNGGGNYALSYVNNTGSTITPKGLSISGITAGDKIYDGTAAATVSTSGAVYSGLVGGDAVTVSATGSFGDKNVGTGKTVALTDISGGADASNYAITNQSSATASITPKTLTVSDLSVADRSYDGTATASVVTGGAQFAGLITGDNFSIASATGSFGDKNVGTGKAVTLATTYSGTDAGNYSVVDQAGTTASITAAPITLSTGNVVKTYDGTTSVTGGTPVVTAGTLFGGDALSGGSFAYTDKNAGVGTKTVTVAGIAVNDGNSGGNYLVTYADNNASTINKAALSISGITAADKTYDGTTAASVNAGGAVYTGLIGGDAVTVAASGAFADANAGTAKTVLLSSTYGGADLGNYAITNQAGTTANIQQAALTVMANNDARFVTQSDSAGYNGVHFSGFVGGDTAASALNLGGLNIARPNAGTDTAVGTYAGALLPSGISALNYAISYTPGNYTILGANNALVKVANVDTGYGSTPGYSVTSVQYMNGSHVIGTLSPVSSSGGNSFSYSDGVGGTLSFALAPANAVLSGSGNVAVGNYAIQDASPVIGGGNLAGAVTFVGNLAVQAKAISANANGVSKVYDGTTAMNNVTLNLTGALSGDGLNISGDGNFSQKNVGSNLAYSVSSLTLGGLDAADYYLVGGSSLSGSNGSITPKNITVSGITAASRVYDGGTAATVSVSGASFNGLVSGDDVGVAASGVFGDKNVGAGKTITLASVYSGPDAANYSFTDQASTLASITPKGLSVSGLAVANRAYDGTTVATVDTSGANYGGLISGDVLQVAATGAFVDKNAGANKAVTLSSSYSGADAGNYSITGQPTALGEITPAAITVSTANVSKVYDGSTSANGSAQLTAGSLFGSDTLSGGSFAYSDKNVGAGNKTVFVSGVGVTDGNGGGNYTVSYVNNSASTITPKGISVSGISTADKVYDGGVSATVIPGTASFNGLVNGDDVGVIATGVFSDKNVGSGKTVTLTSSYTGADIGNYTFTSQAGSSAGITPKALAASGLAVANRAYDGTTIAAVDTSGANYAGLISGDVLHIAATGAFVDKNAGTNKTVTLSSSYSGADAGNYSITSQPTALGEITPAAITVSTGNVSKVYDGNTSANGTALLTAGTLFGSDALNGGSFAYTDKNVGNGSKTVVVSGVSVADGNSGGNYAISYANNSASSITSKAVSVSGISANDKVYDGGTAATVNSGSASINGLVAGDDVNVLAIGSFGDKNAGAGKLVTLSSSYSGPDAGNYSFTDQASTSASITPKGLSVSGLAVANRTYDGTTAATVDASGVNYAGLISGDVVNIIATGSFVNRNAGNNKTVTLNSSYSGADVGNYAITNQADGVADIMPAPLTVTTANISRVYDGTTAANGTALLTAGTLFGSDALSGGSFAYTDKNVGNGSKTVVVSGVGVADGNSGGNYAISYANNSASSITPKAVSVSGISAANKVYDGTTTATVNANSAVVNGLVSGDDVTVVASGAFGDKNAALGKTVGLLSSYSGADAGNYSFTGQATTLADITPKALSVSGLSVANRTYDGTTVATVDASGVNYAGLVNGDAVTILATGSFVDKNAGNNKPVTLSSSYSGADAGNYAITNQADGVADIMPAAITVSTGTLSKVYDGTTAANGTALLTAGTLFGGDSLSGGTFTYNDKNAGNGNKTVLVSGVNVLDGNAGGNYAVSYLNNSTSSITPKAVSVSGITAADKVYDGTTAATISTGSAAINGIISGDDVTLEAIGAFGDKNAATGKTVNLVSSYWGADHANYSVTDQPSTTADITPKALNVSGLAVANRVYDGTTVAAVDTSGVNYAGLIAGDAVQVASTGSFNDKNVGNNKAVALSSSYSGADVGNYLITGQSSGMADITAKVVTLSGITAADKVYDGTPLAILTGAGHVVGLISGDDVQAVTSGVFDSKNVGVAKPVLLSTSYGGSDAGNYSFTSQTSTSASITPKALTVSGIGAADKVYDGTTGATVNATGLQLAGLVAGDDMRLVSSSGSFGDKNVGTGKTVALANAYGGVDLGNYTLTDETSTQARITPKALGVSGLTVADRVYDGTAAAQVVTGAAQFSGLLAGDDVTLSATASFADKNVGTLKPVSIGSSYGGADAGNYSITGQGGTTASITPKGLTISGITAANKLYDGTTTATVSSSGAIYTGLLGGDAVTVNATGAFADPNAGTGKTVNLSSVYFGADVGNYSITSQATTTADIGKIGLLVTANADARFVSQADTPGYNGVHYSGFVNGDTPAMLDTSGLVIVRPNISSDIAVGSYANALMPGGVSASNYTVTYAPGNYTILGANNALVKLANTSTTYGSAPVYTPASVQYMDGNNVIGTLAQTAHSGNSFSYSDGVGGTLQFTLSAASPVASSSGNLSVGNYAILDAQPVIGGNSLQGAVTFTGNLAVQPKAVSASASGVSKVYDGTTLAPQLMLNLSSTLAGDDLGVSGTGSFQQKNVGTNLAYTISGLALSGADSGDYYLSGSNTFIGNNGSITPKAVSVSGITAANKVYDGTTVVTVNAGSATVNGMVGGDEVTIAASGTFSDKNAGLGKTVSLSSSYGGADAGNYNFTDQATTTADIAPKALSVSGLTADSRSYDGTSAAAVNSSGVSYSGFVSGDVLNIVASGQFSDKNAGNGKTVNLSSSYSGADVGNYLITDQAGTTADITPAALTVSTGNVSKDYDGTRVASGAAVLAGGTLYGNDSLSGGTFAYTDKNVGNGNKTVQVSGVDVADGNGGGNYIVTYQDNTGSSITPKAVSVSGITSADKVYDGTSAAAVNSAGARINGLISGDDVSLVATGAFSDQNAGLGKTVNLSSRYGGADAGNYMFTDQASTTADIAPKTLIITAKDLQAAVTGRPFSGGNGVSYDGFVSGEDADVLQGLLRYGGSSQGAISAGSYAILPQGLSSGNYAIRFVGGTLRLGSALAFASPFAPIRNFGMALRTFTLDDRNEQVGLIDNWNSAVGEGFDSASVIGGIAGVADDGPDGGSFTSPGVGQGIGQGSSAHEGGGAASYSLHEERAFGDILFSSVRVATLGTEGLALYWVPYEQIDNGEGFTIPLPERLLRGQRPDVEVHVSLSNGNPLPAWLHYDRRQHVFIAKNLPRGALPLQILITITNLKTTIALLEQR